MKIRPIIYLFTTLLVIIIVISTVYLYPAYQLQLIRLNQLFAFLSLIYLYLALLVSPLYQVFPKFPFEKQYIEARRALGICTFCFALFHSLIAFFGQLGGFTGLAFLNGNYLLSLIFGFIALEIFMIMAITSFDKAIDYLKFKLWKRIHRFVYLASLLTLIHALLLGTHFQDLSAIIPQTTFILLAFLLIIEAIRFDRFLSKKNFSPKFGVSLMLVLFLLSSYTLSSLLPTTPFSLGIHSRHLLVNQKFQSNNFPDSLNSKQLIGDPTLRYSVSISKPDVIESGQSTKLNFSVINAANGDYIKFFSVINEKTVHLVVVDDSLTFFNHIHPIQNKENFSIETLFPKDGRYHLYLSFQPLGAIEQQFAFTVLVGKNSQEKIIQEKPDTIFEKTINGYNILLNPISLKASLLTKGEQRISFTIKDNSPQEPIKTLKPYLGALGHLVMINQQTFEYIHVHPLMVTKTTQDGGPDVTFIPMGLYKDIKPGIYKLFTEFNPNGELIQTDFTVTIK